MVSLPSLFFDICVGGRARESSSSSSAQSVRLCILSQEMVSDMKRTSDGAKVLTQLEFSTSPNQVCEKVGWVCLFVANGDSQGMTAT